MILELSLDFHTSYGQNMFVTGSAPQLGSNDTSRALIMDYDNGKWSISIEFPFENELLSYSYFVRDENSGSFFEVGEKRVISISKNTDKVVCNDHWQGNSQEAPFLTAPFANIFFSHSNVAPIKTHRFSKELIIRVTAPIVEKDASLYIVGNCAGLGSWDVENAIPMIPTMGSRWFVNLPISRLSSNIEYKFIKRFSDGRTAIWEEGENNKISVPNAKNHETHIVEHPMARFEIDKPYLAGTALPIFSLRSKNGSGIGDFTDIKLLVDWAVVTGQSILQFLPINDTTSSFTWRDSYPYNSISVMALHPIYLNLSAIGPFGDRVVTDQYNKERKELNLLEKVDYEAVLKFKKRYALLLFEKYSDSTFSSADYKEFYDRNREWLLPYASFCALRDKFGSADFSKWREYATYSSEIIKMLSRKGSATKRSIDFSLFVQYYLHKQLSESVRYAHSKGVALKGDIPIGIAPYSVEAWSEGKFFNMDGRAGAPPDDFSINGQNWGFPTYNWNELEKDGYRWWKKRLSKMAEYFDAYRIDHILGFFRIWEIPKSEVKGIMGHFNPALPLCYKEMADAGLVFDYYRHSKPYIRYYMLLELFPGKEQFVMDTFLDSSEYEVFTLKPEFDSQKKIESWFEGKNENGLKEALMSLVSEVLFTEDSKKKGYFHPRVCAQYTYSYKALSHQEKEAFNRIYDHFFYERHNELWKSCAMRRLPEIISATNMLCCAEDLGMIPACVADVLRDLKICSLEIQRMPKDSRLKFASPLWYPYLSVCTTGTHDTSTLRGWWEEDRAASQEYYNNLLHNKGTAPLSCEPDICERIVYEHLESASMLTILPLQDWLATDKRFRTSEPDDERINIPAVAHHYWRYRMNIYLEDLLEEKKFNKHIYLLINNNY